MNVIFSDLDGTLLHSQTYSFEAARPALAALRKRKSALVPCTSKTQAEVAMWRTLLDAHDPFIVEDGGAIYIPRGYFPFAVDGAARRDDYDVIEFGAPYLELVGALREAADESGCEVSGFHGMSAEEIATCASLPADQAALAKQREYDEPFEIRGSRGGALLRAIERRGYRWTRGGRFYHITGKNDKGVAVRRLSELYRRAFWRVHTIGAGDGGNDAELLRAVETPVVIRSRFAAALKRAAPRSRVTRSTGPHGWREAMLPLAQFA